MSDEIKCPNPNCAGGKSDLRYVQKSYEYHVLSTMPDEDGYCDLELLDESVTDDFFEPHLRCFRCNGKFKLNGEVIKE